MSVRCQTLSFSWEMSRRGTQSNRAPKKFVTFWEEEERRQPQRAKRVLCCKAVLTSGPPMMSNTVFFMGDEPQRYPKQKRGYCVKLNQTS